MRRAQALLRLAVTELPAPVLDTEREDACLAYLHLLDKLANFGERPGQAAEKMRAAYAQVRGSA